MKNHTNRLISLIFVVLLLFISSDSRTSVLSKQPAAASSVKAEILSDQWGIPHIFAKDAKSLSYAFGWSQMKSHGNLILRLYGQARGRGAEYWGEQYLNSDQWVRINGIPTRASEWLKMQSPAFRIYLESFAAGVNAYAHQHPDRIDDEVKVVLPISAIDLLAHAQRVVHFSFITRPDVVSGAVRQIDSQAGSNAWAIAPSRSASKHALLLANPHLPWSDLFTFYEAHLVVGDIIDAYGATLVGFPVLGIAFNDKLGWSHTVNTHDGQDLYMLTLADGGYRFDGGVNKFEAEEQTIKVKQKGGLLRDERLVVKRSIHGPIIAERNGKAIALRVVGLDQPGMLEQWWDMARANNLKEFITILKRLQLPLFSVMYADRDGHIMHLFGGQTPVRPPGDYNWAGIVPGDISATLWTKTHAHEDLPSVIDPPSGWLQNTNDPPWTTTFPSALDATKFPPYMAPRFMHFRAQRSVRMLVEDNSITFDELIKYKHSTRMEMADRILDQLIAAAQNSSSEKIKRAAKVLASWDRCADPESRGAVLFHAFARRVGMSIFAVRWSENDPRNTPRDLANPEKALAALEVAAIQVESTYGALDIAWGQVYRLQKDAVDLPASGGDGDWGSFSVLSFAPMENNRFRAIGGDCYVASIEFSNPVKAMALLGYGNSSQPGSPHRVDQLPLFSRKELRPVWRKREDIMKHLEEHKIF